MESTPALLIFIACLLLGYLIGSLPFAVIVSRAFGLADPRGFGSGNPGATNVLRTGNKFAALLTLLGDAAKGWVAMWLVAKVGAGDTAIAFTGLAAFLGHLFPIFLRFRGGKGVATAIGVLIGLDGMVALIAALTWAATATIFRYSSLAALAAACVAPGVAYALHGPDSLSLVIGIMCLLLIVRHRPNILRLFAGTENRIGARPPPPPPSREG
ncbi:MAG: glycerol-3-phosphate 1-O-acyltransferase PlsY [Gammaproteobacteria bacterium]|nr:glycerol-3-phosphate 1-O-acyltransferase PlsY [Rhodocyclaceae bacterium]MBU3909356.1 glycerol-3-phosphate 1-O-acyltransferase PlsY [Gammaproteobacteria bacterium]MBU3988558.1 glycerol-3-phosphate 1-O-acyltransferase PlsY [Gammaproteobacteria bacterium]MBU4005484.1 glycerol-3-phosphate 1-O-acyltransferase PlsY [Gammaproteobacteria bacterium]MBU4020963.1 glycerol-3-phosphate 1-O-acyltransferase PlsY [Gammaproteobacteria bacterium]